MTDLYFRDNDAAYLFFENSVLKLSDIYSIEGPAGQNKKDGPWVFKLTLERSPACEFRYPTYNSMVRGFFEDLCSSTYNQNICPNLWPEKERVDLIRTIKASWEHGHVPIVGTNLINILDEDQAVNIFEKAVAERPNTLKYTKYDGHQGVLYQMPYTKDTIFKRYEDMVRYYIEETRPVLTSSICPQLWGCQTNQACLDLLAKRYHAPADSPIERLLKESKSD